MLKCSYIIYAHNNEKTISNVIDSFKKINVKLRKEYIIVDDGSTDSTLHIIKNSVKDLSHATIITHEYSGSAISINKALSLVKSDYIYFVDLSMGAMPELPCKLIDICLKNNVEAVFISTSTKKLESEVTIIEEPLKAIFLNKIPAIRDIGKSASLISYNLLAKIDGADEEIFALNPSLSLRCANFSKFACVNRKNLSNMNFSIADSETDMKFELHNNLLAIYNHIKDNNAIAEKYKNELIYNLYQTIQNTPFKLRYLLKYFLARFFNKYNLEQILIWYEREIKKLF